MGSNGGLVIPMGDECEAENQGNKTNPRANILLSKLKGRIVVVDDYEYLVRRLS